MDPLSVTAGVIALVQAAVGIGKGIRLLRALGEIPDEFRSLLDDLGTLQSVLRHVEVCLREFESTAASGSNVGPHFLVADAGIINSLKNDLADITRELEALCDRLQTKPRTVPTSVNNQNATRVSKQRWHKEKSNIAKLQSKARSTRDYLSLCLSVLNSSQTSVIGVKSSGRVERD